MVHVRKVEIFGFKSFGFRNTTVQFEPGLVSISGPNGSGKSNILDAIIFAMGENKPKVMRVDKLRSLIHDIEGARNRPRMARSSVHFDNSDRRIPVDSDTVEITRELDDKGENTYYLNKKKTNRTHILDLLDVANAGLGQLNAVQQGTVTRISEFSSEEKRKTIEDLVGLSYFDEKKAEALKQLDEADRRLEVALARMDEIKKRIDELEEERNQKLRHDMLRRELDRYRAISAANRIRTVAAERSAKEEELRGIESELGEVAAEHGRVGAEMGSVESEKAGLLEQADGYSRAKSELESEIAAAMGRYEADNAAITVAGRRIEWIGGRLPGIESELADIAGAREVIAGEVRRAEASLAEAEAGRKAVASDLGRVDAQRDGALKAQSEAAARRSAIDERVRSLKSEHNEALLALSKLRHRAGESESRAEANSGRLAEMDRGLGELEAGRKRLVSLVGNHRAAASELRSRISGLRARRAKTEGDMDELQQILEKSSSAATRYESRIKTVKGLMHEDYTVAKLKEEEGIGIEGLVYEMVSWDREYERPVMAVSSDWIKAIVVRDFETLLGVAEVARRKGLPKLRIIPLDAIPEFRLDVPDVPGVLGVLSDHVRCTGGHGALCKFLFGSIVLAEDRRAARAVSGMGYRAVTMGGEYFEARGGTVVIDINSKISKLTKLISMSGDVDGLLRSVSLVRRYLQRKKQAIKKLDASAASNAERLSLSEKSLASAQESLENLDARIGSARATRAQLARRIGELESDAASARSGILASQSHAESLAERVRITEQEYAGGEQDRIAAELEDVNRKKAEAEGRHTAAMNELRERSAALAALQARDAAQATQASRLADESESLVSERSELEDRVARLEGDRGPKKAELERLRQREQEMIATDGSSIGRLRDLDERLTSLSRRERELSSKKGSLQRRSDSLGRDTAELREEEAGLRKVLAGCGVGPGDEAFEVDGMVRGLTAELESLDALNAKAPETYLEVSDGYRSMSDRKNSLEGERNTIVRFIEGVEKDKRQTFLDAFDRVDKEIRAVFGKMTGGNAWLELQNEDDIFNSGISYLIQFPNKPKRESNSISGGEKTLAAVVFVLALQRLKPSPFYLFDEVDAHLDAPNSERLSRILEERAKESQFIMVSLKDSVVQKANLIYGVFPKNGVSNVVTYKDRRMPHVRT